MSFEMICGQCRGNLLVEQFGVVVACPHCGAHLHVPAPADAAPAAPPPAPVPAPIQQVTPPVPPPEPPRPPEPIAESTPPAPTQVDPDPVLDTGLTTDEMRVFTGNESEPPPSVEISIAASVSMSDETAPVVEHVAEEATETTPTDERFSLSALMSSSESAETAAADPNPTAIDSTAAGSVPAVPEVSSTPPAAAPAESPIEPAAVASEPSAPPVVTEPIPEPVAEALETVPSGLSGLFGSSAVSTPPESTPIAEAQPVADAVAPAEPASESESSPHDDHSAMLAADSVPPAVTKPADKDHVTISKSLLLILFSYASAVTLGFLYLLYYGSTNTKDYGLESLPDIVPAKKKTSGVYRETQRVPDGHELKVGDQQRFGNIEVTVLKVTRGSVQFRHFSDASKSRLPTAPVLKLWLRFKNVSEDQEIAPLDDQLLFHRIGRDRFSYHSNQFVVRADQQLNREALRVIAYDHIIGSGWDLVDLPLDKPLQPGESRDYYVPTCENDLDKLAGDLLWRVHIRKGYSARGNGVTTLFEVHFHSDAIRDEQA